jgi:hypothetical protein
MTGSDGPRAEVGRAVTIRNVVLAVTGAVVLVLGSAYRGPFDEAFQAHSGNVAVSFALYFAALNATARLPRPRLLAASLTLLAVELFEATDGFGVMSNTYDPVDFVANAAGIGVAVVVDLATARVLRRRHERRQDGPGEASS